MGEVTAGPAITERVIREGLMRASRLANREGNEEGSLTTAEWFEVASLVGRLRRGHWRDAQFEGASEVHDEALKLEYRFLSLINANSDRIIEALSTTIRGELAHAEADLGAAMDLARAGDLTGDDVWEFLDDVIGRLDKVGFAMEALAISDLQGLRAFSALMENFERRTRPALGFLDGYFRREGAQGYQFVARETVFPSTFWWRLRGDGGE